MMTRAFFILFLLFFALAGCASKPAAPAVDVVVGRGGDLWRLRVADGEYARLTAAAPAGSAYQPAVAPGGEQVAYTFRAPLPPAEPGAPLVVPQPTIYIQPLAAGGAPGAGEPLIPNPDPQASFDQPAWAPDGRTLYATRRAQVLDAQGAFIGASQELIAVDAAAKTWRPLFPQAEGAAPAPDGAALAATRPLTTSINPQLVLFDLAGGQERVLVNDPRFVGVEGATWSADSQTIYFAATQQAGDATPAPGGWLDNLGPATASAHGNGWTIWAIDRSGANLREINPTRFEDPRMVLADGKLLVWSFTGLWLVDPADGSAAMLYEPGDVSGISRLP